MHFNVRTNVVSECCAGPQAARQRLYSQPYYTCVTLTDVPKLLPAARSCCLLLYELMAHPLSIPPHLCLNLLLHSRLLLAFSLF